MEKLSPNRAQLFVRNKYTVFTMGGTVALRSSCQQNFFPESYSSAATLAYDVYIQSHLWQISLVLCTYLVRRRSFSIWIFLRESFNSRSIFSLFSCIFCCFVADSRSCCSRLEISSTFFRMMLSYASTVLKMNCWSDVSSYVWNVFPLYVKRLNGVCPLKQTLAMPFVSFELLGGCINKIYTHPVH